ncbi:MAG: EpsI family protein [Acidobacteriota bacterium]|nr:EpsI family protein [Acidobacteriota bacterium]
MSAINREWRSVLVPAFLAAQCLVVYAMSTGEHAPLAPASDTFPASFATWTLFRADPIDAAISKQLGADRLVSQTYIESSSGAFASLLVAWFQTQREGVRQPHSPKVCLPGAGWTPRVADQVTVDTAAGSITVNRYIVDRDARRAVVLYWYQTPRRVIANEWAAKFWLAADALRDKRTDTALVRIIAWPSGGGDAAATAAATGFARNLYPTLRAYLPH